MINKFTTFAFLLLATLNMGVANANNARVIEIQEKIKVDISNFVEKFSPKTKYSVQVKVKPLRRRYEQSSQGENLPFMEFQDDLILDEWDDPNVNVYSLYSRISEAKVTIYIEDNVKIENRSRFKDALLKDVNLVPGRDSVEIEAITSPVLVESFNWKDQTEILFLGVMLIIAVVLGVGLNSLAKRLVPQQVAKTTSDNKNTNSNSSFSGGAPSVASAPISSSSGNSSGFSELKGDLNIQDPSKINEVVGKKIIKLLESDVFPTLSDMVILEDLLKNDSSSFSYLVYEFPLEIQKSIYQLGKGEQWFKGFSEVGFPSKIVLLSLDTMLRNRTVHQNEKFESLLIHTWRLTKNLTSFMKTMSKEEAFSILYFLPKDISIPVSRECFPGSWGGIFEDRPVINLKDSHKVQKLLTEALKLQPYLNYDSLQVFKNRKDLLTYLDTVEPHEEKDIYSVMGEKNDLSSIRPPFYSFFELEIENRKKVYQAFSMNEWAVACFNIGRHNKDTVTELMDDKEKYLFSHVLKEIDHNPSLAANKIQIRHAISHYIYENYSRQNQAHSTSSSQNEDVKPADDENNVA
jgi:hypothetical protein